MLVDFVIPPKYDGTLSALMPIGTGFTIGPNAGYVWVRFSITERPVSPTGGPWDGSGNFEDGETEDYLLRVDAGNPEDQLKFQQLPLNGAMVNQVHYYGHDELSTAYRQPEDPTTFEGCYMADDFADLHHSPVVKLKWWGSYLENEIMDTGIMRFLIVFEKDVPAVGEPGQANYIPSHPGEVIQSQFVHRAPTGSIPNRGEYTETQIGTGGPPCNEALFEYKAVLLNPFPQDPNTVYWLKLSL